MEIDNIEELKSLRCLFSIPYLDVRKGYYMTSLLYLFELVFRNVIQLSLIYFYVLQQEQKLLNSKTEEERNPARDKTGSRPRLKKRRRFNYRKKFSTYRRVRRRRRTRRRNKIKRVLQWEGDNKQDTWEKPDGQPLADLFSDITEKCPTLY